MEGRQPVGCFESVRADRRANGPQHPLICGMAASKSSSRLRARGSGTSATAQDYGRAVSVRFTCEGAGRSERAIESSIKPFCRQREMLPESYLES
jgi:hypothetical protein